MQHLTDRSAAIQWFLTIAGLSGIASIFLNFTTDVSPFGAVFYKNFWVLGFPFLISVVISVYLIRWNLTGRLSLFEQIIAYLINLPMVVFIFLRMADVINNLKYLYSATTGVIFFAGSLIAGIWLAVRNHDLGEFKNLSPIMLMQTVYISNGILCLIGFRGDWQIGAYFTIATVIAYAAQIVWFSCLYDE